VASGTISVSAASDEGSSIIYDAPTLTDELSEYVWQIYDLFIRTVNYAASLDEVQSIIEYLHNQPIYKAMTSKVLTDVVLTGLLIIFFFWTYARRKSLTALVAGIVVGLLTWLIADFKVPAPWVLAPLLLVGYYKYILPFVIAPPTELSDIAQIVWIIIWVCVIPAAALAIAWSAFGDTQITGSILVGLIVCLLWRSV